MKLYKIVYDDGEKYLLFDEMYIYKDADISGTLIKYENWINL